MRFCFFLQTASPLRYRNCRPTVSISEVPLGPRGLYSLFSASRLCQSTLEGMLALATGTTSQELWASFRNAFWLFPHCADLSLPIRPATRTTQSSLRLEEMHALAVCFYQGLLPDLMPPHPNLSSGDWHQVGLGWRCLGSGQSMVPRRRAPEVPLALLHGVRNFAFHWHCLSSLLVLTLTSPLVFRSAF